MRFVVAAAVFFGALLAAETSFAFCRQTTCAEGETCDRNTKPDCVHDGIAVRWNTTTLPYRIYAKGSSKLDDDEMKKAVRAAFDAWQTVDCDRGRTSLRFVEGEPITKDKPLGLSADEAEDAGVEPYGIYFRDKKWTHDGSDDVLAATGLAFGLNRGIVSYADIEVNTFGGDFTMDDDQSAKAVDLQAVLTHEVGHYLGLAHSLDPDSIMAPRYCTSEERCETNGVVGKRALGEDDIAAVCAFFPPGLTTKSLRATTFPSDDSATGAGGCSSAGQPGAPVAPVAPLAPVASAAVPLAILALRRRRRA
ncbi:MAG: matrixin family metalloprotease [Labilithrix sp.]